MPTRDLADHLTLGALLEHLRTLGGYRLLDHWQQGEFHHDTVLDVGGLGFEGRFLIVATNCNGGIKEVLLFATLPTRGALWRRRCPSSAEFAGELPPIVDEARTVHWFDPCELLVADARSEIRAEFRERVPGGGWAMCGKRT